MIGLLEACLQGADKHNDKAQTDTVISSQIQIVSAAAEKPALPKQKIPEPQKPKAVRLTKPKPRKPEQLSDLHKNTSGKLTLEPKEKKTTIKSKTEKKIKLITRSYEIPTMSYEYTDLLTHMPNRVFNLNQPIEKADEAYLDEHAVRFKSNPEEKEEETLSRRNRYAEDYLIVREDEEIYKKITTEYKTEVEVHFD